jgi:NADP-dependent 3-hydroxy acid dehydrogenase YdfG
MVTGSAGVPGSEMVKGLIIAGAKVGILSRTESKVLARAKEIESVDGEAISLAVDVW